MQKYSKLLVVLPCHSLEDFPTHHRGDEAADLLANWTALWHPALIANCSAKPDWHQADNPECNYESDPTDDPSEAISQPPPSESQNVLLALIPEVAQSTIDSELIANLNAVNAVVIESDADSTRDSIRSRQEIVDIALAANPNAAQLATNVDPEIAQDFHALGYAYLQVQLMTRQLRYSSNLDETVFSQTCVSAAEFATQGDHEKAKAGLTRCFDMLLEEKNAYYPVEPEIMDVVLTAKTTLGKSLRRQLEQKHCFNILMTGTEAETLSANEPDSLVKLITRVLGQANSPLAQDEDTADVDPPEKVAIIGGLQDELPEPLVSTESLINQLAQGRKTIQELLGVEPTIFMRRRFGLGPSIPGVLEQFDFTGAIHATLDDGKYPLCSAANFRWTGDDDRSILSHGEPPLSADDEGSFVGLGVKLGETIDSAHIACVVFCHWPDKTCQSFKDLLRISKYGSLLGSFVNIEDYFESVYDPGYGDTFTSDEYRDPYLKQAVQRETPNPISSATKYWQRFYKLNSARALLTQICAKTAIGSAEATEIQNKIADFQTAVESELIVVSENHSIDESIEELVQQMKSQWLGAKLGSTKTPTDPPAAGSAKSIELINTTSFKRRISTALDSQNIGTIRNQSPIILAEGTKQGSHWVAQAPAMGTVKISTDSLGQTDQFKSDPPVAEDLVLRNEFFELHVDQKTGGIRGIELYGSRVNLASQQLAIRIPSQRDSRNQPLTKARYTRMVADKIETKSTSRLSGTIFSSGKLLDQSEPLARFEQTISLSRGQRIASVKIKIELLSELTASLNHYVCSRLAWKSEASRVIANAKESRTEISSDWFTATNFIEIAQDDQRLVMLTGGLPYHRRVSRRMLDSLLIVGNESQREFEYGIGVNVGYPMAAAVDWMSPMICIESNSFHNGTNTQETDLADAPVNKSGWLFHLDRKNILVTWWRPFFGQASGNEDRWAGVELRLRETEGRSGTLNIRCPQVIATGERVNFAGDFLESLSVSEDDETKLELDFGRFDYLQISIHWKK